MIQDLPVEKQHEVMVAILSFPAGNSDTHVWNKVIRPQLEQSAKLYEEKTQRFAENRKKRWQQKSNQISVQTSVQKSNQISNRYQNVNVDVDVKEEVNVNNSGNNISSLRTTRAKKQSFVPPTLEEVIAYCDSRSLGKPIAQKIFDYYSSSDWHDSTGKKIQNWKAKIIAVWDKPENHVKDPDDEPFYL
jgi:hypothetical protein